MNEHLPLPRTPRWAPWLLLALALALFGAAIGAGTWRLRRSLGDQLINRDGDLLNAVAQARLLPGGETNLAVRLQNPAEQLALVLNISQIMDGVLAVRLFDSGGTFVTAFPAEVAEGKLTMRTVTALQQLHTVSRYRSRAVLGAEFFPGTAAAMATNPTPLLEVNLPIHAHGQDRLLASAQIMVDAQPLQRALAALDYDLGWQAGGAWLAGSALLTGVFAWAWRRLQHSQALLQARTTRLLHANHELSLTARTGALGAVTAHLVHGLSNPLANLQAFMRAQQDKGLAGEEWQDLVASTGRMRQIIQEVVRVLAEENCTDDYEITLAELAEIFSQKIAAPAQAAGVVCDVRAEADGHLNNRHANLVLLILDNLARNALQVTPRGRRVRVRVRTAPGGVVCQVADEGPGYPAALRDRLFLPCPSRHGGNGIGLAISHQLASQMGAELDLAKTDANGCIFELTIPSARLAEALAKS